VFNKKNLLIILLLLLSVTSLETWEAEFKKVCTYDPVYCKRLKSDGEFKEPEPSLVSTLESYRQDMLSAAKASGIDARAIAGAILTENTLNVNLKDRAQNFLVSMGLAKDGKFLGKGFSYGFGQINCDRARDVEKAAAKIYARSERSTAEVCNSLLDPKETIKYIGVIIRDAIDTYKEKGIDISGDIGIQTTLYNLGGVKQRAEAAKANNALPKVNFFGLFTNMHLDQLGKITTINTAVRKSEFKNDEDYDLVDGVNSSLELKSNPPFCDQKIDSDIRKSPEVKPTITKSETGPIEILNRYLDCDSKPWVLIKDSNNNEGWVKEYDLEKKTTKFAVQDTRQCEYEEPACVEAIKNKNKYSVHSIDQQFDGLVFNTNGGGKASGRGFSRYNPDCAIDSNQGGYGYSYANQPKMTFPNAKLSSKEVLQLRQKLIEVLKKNSNNPDIFNAILSKFYSLNICESNCYGNYKEIDDYITGDYQSTKVTPLITTDNYQSRSTKITELARVCTNNESNVRYFFMENYNHISNIKTQNKEFVDRIISECMRIAALPDDEKKNVSLIKNLIAIKNEMGLKDSGPYNSSDVSSCSINLGQTLTNLTSFLVAKCTNKVYVPDQTLYALLNNIYPGKIGFISSSKSDKYTVTFRETCRNSIKVLRDVGRSKSVNKAN